MGCVGQALWGSPYGADAMGLKLGAVWGGLYGAGCVGLTQWGRPYGCVGLTQWGCPIGWNELCGAGAMGQALCVGQALWG